MHRRRVLTATAVAAVLALAACAPGEDAPETGDAGTSAGGGGEECADRTTLDVWSWRTEDADAYEQIFDVFEEANPCITVAFQAFKNTEYNQILQTGLTGSDGPDVAQVRSYGLLQPLVDGGNLVALDDVVPALAEFDDAILDGARGQEDGAIYGVPFASQTIQVYYNTAIFSEHGLSEPETWEEFIQLNDTLEAAGVTPLAVGAKDAWFVPTVHDALTAAQYGGAEFQQALREGATDFTDPAYVASIETFKDLEQYMPEDVVAVGYTDAQVLFTAEQAAMFAGGSYELAFFQSTNPDLELGVFQVPPPPNSALDHPVSAGYADGNWGLSAASDSTEEAETLLSWLAGSEFGQMVANDLKQFSPVPGVSFDEPLMQEMWNLYQENPAPYLLLVDYRYGDPVGTDLMGEGGQQLFLDELDAAGVAARIQDGLSAWWTPGQ
ncbi:ABC transporter substrate-binding protein [Georgenia subflava]|uniref:Extracellular solute-binding protein n=1 Tax=Georgenia subflava TaxID=1622177 RepID=A0A6N7EPL3_9MICO|nr:extracellular solute-binding protein [Georgenia subflava]MPV38807.1 extracellular solute-binding protein [Georgenia subflava]